MQIAKINVRTHAGRSSNICAPHFGNTGGFRYMDRNLTAKIIFRHKIKFQQAKFPIRVTDYVSVHGLPFMVGSIVRIQEPIQLSVKC